MELQFSIFSHIFSYLTSFCEKDTLPILISLRSARAGTTPLQRVKIWQKSAAYLSSKSASKMEKNANSALHTAKSVKVDSILRETYTSAFDESSHIEGGYTPVQRVKIWQKSPAYVSSKSASKMEKNANSARHTAKSVIVDRILRERYTSCFDESPLVEVGYSTLQCVKISQKSTAQIWSKSTLKMTKTLIHLSTPRKVLSPTTAV